LVTMAQSSIDSFNPPDVAKPGGHYTHARRHGNLVFTSGQLGIRPDGSHTANLPFEDQVRQTLGNLLAVLRAAGAEKQDILRVTAYIVGVAQWPTFNAIYAEMMGDARPARTVVPVAELHFGYQVELDAVAVCSGSP
jgi:2-iminobutanoate/2-iminopropanoate deaminase